MEVQTDFSGNVELRDSRGEKTGDLGHWSYFQRGADDEN